MSVTGPLAFRSMQWQQSADGELAVASPFMSKYTWAEKWAWAECNCGGCDMTEPPYDIVDNYHWPVQTIIPRDASACGMWSTVNRDILMQYYLTQGAVIFLVEALGDWLVYEDAGTMRSAGIEILYVVNYGLTSRKEVTKIENHEYSMETAPSMLSAMAAASYYNVGMQQLDVCQKMVEIQWGKLGLNLPRNAWRCA